MIKGIHAMFYSSEPEALRVFVRDKLGFPAVDVGDGWLIFDLPEADMGCHPTDTSGKHGPPSGTEDRSGAVAEDHASDSGSGYALVASGRSS